MGLHGLKIGLVGPVPPPSGGMAGQTLQFAELLAQEGADVTLVPVNAPYRPRWVKQIRVIRAISRLTFYGGLLWRVAGRVQIMHIMANSGWSWHLFAAPAIWMAKLRGTPTVVNYRGGEADSFLARSGRAVAPTLRRATVLVVPSAYLQQIFDRRGLPSAIVPNIIDTRRFRAAESGQRSRFPCLVVARNLETIYDIPTALRAFALVSQTARDARLVVAGSGPQEQALKALTAELGIAQQVDFRGQLDRDQMAALYRSASIVLNPSLVDNMPNSVLEAMASGVPVVSTDVGGIPFILRDGVTGLLVCARDDKAMAAAARRLLSDPELAARLSSAGLVEVQKYTWPRVRAQ
ncbi:MAG: glycosyltransferase family 4 protein, partial [Terriglobia bacterium]